MIDCMMCLHYVLFILMVDKGYLIIWGVVEFKAFHALFC